MWPTRALLPLLVQDAAPRDSGVHLLPGQDGEACGLHGGLFPPLVQDAAALTPDQDIVFFNILDHAR